MARACGRKAPANARWEPGSVIERHGPPSVRDAVQSRDQYAAVIECGTSRMPRALSALALRIKAGIKA